MVTQGSAPAAKLPPASEASHADADAPAQEMRAFLGRQRQQAADQVALGEITLLVERFQPGLSADAWLLQALSPKHGKVAWTAGCLLALDDISRSEERRVGKECRSRWSPYH